jgi:hypothetical protein
VTLYRDPMFLDDVLECFRIVSPGGTPLSGRVLW